MRLIGLIVLLVICMYTPHSTYAQSSIPTKILFIHHSTGGNLLHEGNIRQKLYQSNPNLVLWDHGYNLYPSVLLSKLLARTTFRTGLSDQDGHMTGVDYDITISNNSPKEYAEIFSRDPADPTLSKILEYDVIIFKNCYPTTRIESDEKLQEHISYYNDIRDSVRTYNDKTFIVFTPPPLRKEMTQPAWALRARRLSDYMTSDKFVTSDDNLKVFHYFDLLADTEGENMNMLRREYARWNPYDSHPNKRANEQVGEILVQFILNI